MTGKTDDPLQRALAQQKEVEEALRRSEERYRTLVEGQGEGIGIVDEAERFTFANPAAERIFGVPSGTMVGRGLRDFLDEEEYGRIQQQTDRRKAGSRDSYEMEFTRPDGQRCVLLVTATPRFDDEGGYTGAFGIFRDITERKQAEEALRESEERYRQLIESLPHGVGIVQHGRIVFVNRAAVRILRHKDQSALEGLEPEAIVVEEDRDQLRRMTTGLLRGEVEGPLRQETRLVAADDDEIPVEVYVTAITHTRERALQVCFIDTSQRLRAEADRQRLVAQLMDARKLESIGRLAGGIAHEFNNLLTPVVINTNVALKDIAPSDPRRQDFEDILEAATRAKDLTRQLLAFGRRQLLQTRLLDANQLIEAWNETLRHVVREDVEIRLELTQPLEWVQADPAQLQQVLVNLVLNARDSMPEGGTIDVRTAGRELSEDTPDLPAGRYVVLEVQDTGLGMAPEMVHRIFDPFYSTKNPGGGTGLGLASVHGVVKQHGGHIEVESEQEKGSVFRVFLPAHAPLPQQPPPRKESRLTPAPEVQLDQTVLVVEDEVLLRRQMCRILTRYGLTVLEAGDGCEALELAGGHEGTIDLLLTDVVMPRMNGQELERQLREARPEIKVVFMSGYSDTVLGSPVKEDVSFLEKPFTLQALVEKVREALVVE